MLFSRGLRNVFWWASVWWWSPCATDARSSCEGDRPFLRFHKLRICHRSQLPVIGWKHVSSDVSECMRFARERGGLAFNYSPPEAADVTGFVARNCEVLGCPEVGRGATLVLDETYDYYSAYGNLNATANATCIKSVGVFSLTDDKLNYTEAIRRCQSTGGDLPSVLSETRTAGLSKLVEGEVREWYKAAYVGLDDAEAEGVYATPLGSPLRCTAYRAWAPGHPRSQRPDEDCVILDARKMWRVVDCAIKLPFVCEFYPESPLGRSDVPAVGGATCGEMKDEKKRNKCLKDLREFRKLFDKSSRLDKCAFMSE